MNIILVQFKITSQLSGGHQLTMVKMNISKFTHYNSETWTTSKLSCKICLTKFFLNIVYYANCFNWQVRIQYVVPFTETALKKKEEEKTRDVYAENKF